MMAAHKFWRFEIKDFNTTFGVPAAAGFELTDASGAIDLTPRYVNLFSGGTATAWNEASAASRAVDNDWSTYFQGSNFGTKYWQYVAPTPVGSTLYSIMAYAITAQAPKSWTLEYSTNSGSTWQVAHTVTNEPAWQSYERRYYTFPSVGSATHWRLNNVVPFDGGSQLMFTEFGLLQDRGVGAEMLKFPPNVVSPNVPLNLVDNNATTIWQWGGSSNSPTNLMPMIFDFELAVAKDIISHSVTGLATANDTKNLKAWNVSYSDDGNVYTPAALVSGQTTWSSSEKKTFSHAAYALKAANNGAHSVVSRAVVRTPPAWATRLMDRSYLNARMFTPAGPHSYVTGTVTEDGVPAARVVRLYRRDNGFFLNQIVSAADGTFQMSSNGFKGECVLLVFSDLSGPPNYNAVVYDGVIPI